ncbi:LamG domain-containing protein, partial [Patescibacteria group bacterium]|nr:LamG domain-containing protein [Patescibacteria group bacterium]
TSLEEGLETTGFTGSFWIKFDDFNNGDDPSIIDKSDGNVFMLGLNGSTDDETRFRLNVGASTKTLPSADDSAFGVNASTWYYIVHAYGGTQPNGLRTYIDGIEVGSTTDSGTINMPSTGATHIAERADDAGQNIDGIIDELRLSNTGHTEEWIKFEYHSQKITARTITLAAQDLPPVTGGRSQPSFYFISKEVTDITSDSAVVSWNTSIPTDTQLNWSSSLKES